MAEEMTVVLKEGDKAPDFDVPASNGKRVSLKDLKGKKVVLYFYPKDDTPGCTVEACSFKENIKKIESQEAVVLGVSPDGLESHQKFIEKFSLPFTLLSDEGSVLCKQYGVWQLKTNYGKEYMGVVRTTFLIDKEGKIAKIYSKVKPEGHPEQVLEDLKAI